jgi:hypothetical protein
VPFAGAQNHRDDDCLAARLALERSVQFDVVALVGCDEVGAHEQQHDVGSDERFIDGMGEMLAGRGPAIVPDIDEVLDARGSRGVHVELAPQLFVGVG